MPKTVGFIQNMMKTNVPAGVVFLFFGCWCLSVPVQADTFSDKATGDWGGARTQLEETGISVDAGLIIEGFRNFRGGLNNSRTVGASTFDLSLTVDAEKLMGWRGGTFYVDFEDHEGKNPSNLLVGDLQVFDKLNTSPYMQLFEIWYQQTLFEDKVRIKLGKVDGNSEFSVIDNGLVFLNSSSQVSPTCFLLPTTPDPMPGLNVFITPNDSYYVGFGVFYSNRSEHFGVIRGRPQDAQQSEFGAFVIGEGGLRWDRSSLFGNDGDFKVGVWEHTGTFTTFDGDEQKGTHGYYVVFDQTLWQPSGAKKGGRGVRMFLDGGQTQRSINAIDYHVGGGMTWTGFWPERSDDIVGVNAHYAHISDEAGLNRPYELALETFYKLQLTRWAAIQPDLQYVANPGGQYPNALVLTLRSEISF